MLQFEYKLSKYLQGLKVVLKYKTVLHKKLCAPKLIRWAQDHYFKKLQMVTDGTKYTFDIETVDCSCLLCGNR
jgi:hypothetical protein